MAAVLCGSAGLGTAWGGAAPVPAKDCAPTAETAVARMLAHQDSGDVPGGFRVASIRVDHVRGQSWAYVASCASPTAPLRAIALPKGTTVLNSEIQIHIHIGEQVRVIKQTADSQMELTGIAEDSAEKGESIRVRLPRLSDDATVPAPEILCRVLGQGVVEALR